MKLFTLIRSDIKRFEQTYTLRDIKFNKFKVWFESFVFKPGFQAVFLYRLSHFFFAIKWTYVAWIVSRFNQFFTGAEIEFNARIGPGMFIAHPCGIVIGRGTRIGSDVTIFQGVTFGTKSWNKNEIQKFPSIENRCCFFAQSTIIGGINIGSDCVVGANSLLNKDLPHGCMAVGVPAKIYANIGKEKINEWGFEKGSESR